MFAGINKCLGGLLLLFLVITFIVPKFVKARINSNVPNCRANLKIIDQAIEQWALENRKLDSDVPELAAATKYFKGGVLPKCPQGGTYQAGAAVTDVLTCTKASTLGYSLLY